MRKSHKLVDEPDRENPKSSGSVRWNNRNQKMITLTPNELDNACGFKKTFPVFLNFSSEQFDLQEDSFLSKMEDIVSEFEQQIHSPKKKRMTFLF